MHPPTVSEPYGDAVGHQQKTTVSVMWNQALYSGNGQTGFGNATANNNILYLTNDTVTYYDQDLNLVNNKSFGTYEKVSDAPLTVKQTVADTATWSDGVPVTPADYVLSYGAQSGLFNNYEPSSTRRPVTSAAPTRTARSSSTPAVLPGP